MCFSSTASFTAAAVLIPTGIYTISYSSKMCQAYIGLAILPLGFGLQQLAEGLVWLILSNEWQGRSVAIFSFLFFSHFFWLMMVPLSAWLAEDQLLRKKSLAILTTFGILLGLSMLIPLIVYEDWYSAVIQHNSIYYSISKIYDGYLSTGTLLFIYVCTILVPLFLSSRKDIRLFGYILGISMIITLLFFTYAFVSIWCYFAALLSFMLLFVIKRASVSNC